MVIVDSIISLPRAEFTGRETLAERQKRLNIMLNKLLRLAEVHNVAVVVTNQVQSQPDNFFSDAGGGNRNTELGSERNTPWDALDSGTVSLLTQTFHK